jgi:hypothetical protein
MYFQQPAAARKLGAASLGGFLNICIYLRRARCVGGDGLKALFAFLSSSAGALIDFRLLQIGFHQSCWRLPGGATRPRFNETTSFFSPEIRQHASSSGCFFFVNCLAQSVQLFSHSCATLAATHTHISIARRMSLEFSPQRLKLLPKSWKTPQICIKIPFGARNFGLQRRRRRITICMSLSRAPVPEVLHLNYTLRTAC